VAIVDAAAVDVALVLDLALALALALAMVLRSVAARNTRLLKMTWDHARIKESKPKKWKFLENGLS